MILLFFFFCKQEKLNPSNLSLLNQLGYNYGNPWQDSYNGNDMILRQDNCCNLNKC